MRIIHTDPFKEDYKNLPKDYYLLRRIGPHDNVLKKP